MCHFNQAKFLIKNIFVIFNTDLICLFQTDENNTGFIGPFTLIIHGTVEIPEHMKKGPRKYSDEYDYQQAFKYFDSLNDMTLSSGDYHNETVRADFRKFDDIILNIGDPSVFNQVEDELQRIHHGQNWLEDTDRFVNPYMPIWKYRSFISALKRYVRLPSVLSFLISI